MKWLFYILTCVSMAGQLPHGIRDPGWMASSVPLLRPDSFPGLQVWLSSDANVFSDAGGSIPCADGDTVYVWKDRSVNGNDVNQTTAGLQPYYRSNTKGIPGIQFGLRAGSCTYLEKNVGFSMATPYTIVCVWFHYTNSNVNFDTLFSNAGSGPLCYTTHPYFYFYQSGPASIGKIPATNSWNYLFWSFLNFPSGQTNRVFVPGKKPYTDLSAGTATFNHLRIGSKQSTAGMCPHTIAEFIVITNTISEQHRQGLEKYIRKKYNFEVDRFGL